MPAVGKRNIFRTLLSILLLSSDLVLFSQVTFQGTFEGQTNPYNSCNIIQTSNGNYVAETNFNGESDIFRLDLGGGTIWKKKYSINGILDFEISDMKETSDGGLVFIGVIDPNGFVGVPKLGLLKTDASGVAQWAKVFQTIDTIGVIKVSSAYLNTIWKNMVIETSDKGFLIGSTLHKSWADNQGYVIKTDANGALQWSRTYKKSVTSNDYCTGIQQTNDGGYVVLTSCIEGASGGFSVYKTDNTGAIQWSNFYDNGALTVSASKTGNIQQTADGGYILVGPTLDYFTTVVSKSYMVKLNGSGGVSWSKTYDTNDFSCYVLQSNDGGYLLINVLNIAGTQANVAIKTDNAGAVSWAKHYGAGSVNTAGNGQMAIQTNDNGYAIVGIKTDYTLSFPFPNKGMHLIKTDAMGVSGCEEANVVIPAPGTLAITITNSGVSVNNTLATTAFSGAIATYGSGSASSFLCGPFNAFIDKTNVGCPGANDGIVVAKTIGGAGPYTYVWSPGNYTTPSLNNIPAGTYSVAVTDVSSGVTVIATATVTPSKFSPTVTTAYNSTVCLGNSTVVSASGAASYAWKVTPDLNPQTGANIIATPSALGVNNYSVVGTNTLGCTGTSNFAITTFANPVFTVPPNDEMCQYDTTTLSCSGSYNFQWLPAVLVSPAFGPNVFYSANSTGLYSFSVTATDPGTGCISTQYFNRTVYAIPLLSAGKDTSTCVGNPVVLTASTNGSNVVWSPAGGLSTTNSFSTAATLNAAGSYTYVVTATDNKGCVNTDSIGVEVLTSLSPDIGPDISICAKTPVTLNASGIGSFVWSSTTILNNYAGSSTSLTPTAPGTVICYVDATSGNCTGKDSIKINVLNLPVISAFADIVICPGETTSLSAFGGSKYSWAPSVSLLNSTVQVVAATPNSTTSYTVTGYDFNDCKNTAVVMVSLYPLVSIDAGPDITIIKGLTTTLNVTGGVSYLWMSADPINCNSCSSITVGPETTTSYTVSGVDANGCIAQDLVTVFIKIICAEPFIPTAFSPNDDGQNDMLTLKGDCIEKMLFKIFDRWGDLVFEATSLDESWDGKKHNKPLDTGVFVYSISFTTSDGVKKIEKGNLSLIR